MLRFGIIGTGNIAAQFAAGVGSSLRSRVVAVASRDAAKAQQFAAKFGVARAYGSYAELLADGEVDAVYVSLPNNLHAHWSIAAMRAGKHVLCEKPIAMNAAEAGEMFAVSRETGRLLVEAFMYRSHPQTDAVLAAVRGGEIGNVRLIRTSFCYRTRNIDGNVRFDAALGGGAIMDVGCYCVSLSRLVAGAEPTSVQAVGLMHERGVDVQGSGVLQFPGGVVASFNIGMNLQADNTAMICGDEGYIEIGWPWKPPRVSATHVIARAAPPRMDAKAAAGGPGREERKVDAPVELYGLEADDFAAAVAGERAARVSESDTLGNMRVLDELRRRVCGTATW